MGSEGNDHAIVLAAAESAAIKLAAMAALQNCDRDKPLEPGQLFGSPFKSWPDWVLGKLVWYIRDQNRRISQTSSVLLRSKI